MNRIMSAAAGETPFDLVLKNAQFVNVHTEEIYLADIGVVDDRIARVTQPGEAGLTGAEEYDCAGRFAVPGLIDTHVHIESGMMTPANFARTVIPHGTTTVLADPHEFCNVLGVEGMEYCAGATENIRLRVFLAAPSCVPSVVGVESGKMVFNAPEIAAMLDMPKTLALGEVMDYPGVINQNPRMTAIVAEARKRHKLIQGHVIGVPSGQLSAYMAAGIESDHESRGLEEVVTRLRAGMVVECRHGSSAQNIAVEAEALALLNYPVNATLCTDDREPDDLLHEGHIDEAIRQAIKGGVPSVKAVQMATRNAALFLGLRDRGSLKPGSLADIALVDGLESFSVSAVFIGGVLCAEKGALVVDIDAVPSAIEQRNTMNIKGELERGNFRIPAKGESVLLNCLSFLDGDPFVTTLKEARFPVIDGCADISAVPGFVTMAVIERHNRTGNIGIAPAENIGLERGAIAGTVTHDSHNLFVFGANVDDMLVAARRLVETGGGFAAADGGRIVGEIRLPVCGLVSLKPAAEIAQEAAAMKTVLNGLGIHNPSPVHFLTWFCLAVLPEARLTDRGLIDTLAQKPIPLYADAGS
ncbi:MAG: amidohydrolase family protein [Planctomycetota bacterium]|jgi:adenine deaminase|nr:amidohydrolase family protein [Planctomycetota bacterium]